VNNLFNEDKDSTRVKNNVLKWSKMKNNPTYDQEKFAFIFENTCLTLAQLSYLF